MLALSVYGDLWTICTRNHFHDAHGHERLSAVVQREVVAWREHLAADPDTDGLGLAPATVNAHLASLSGFTTWVRAHEETALPHGNPCAKVSDPAGPQRHNRGRRPVTNKIHENGASDDLDGAACDRVWGCVV